MHAFGLFLSLSPSLSSSVVVVERRRILQR
jgi:hypothetical protein